MIGIEGSGTDLSATDVVSSVFGCHHADKFSMLYYLNFSLSPPKYENRPLSHIPVL